MTRVPFNIVCHCMTVWVVFFARICFWNNNILLLSIRNTNRKLKIFFRKTIKTTFIDEGKTVLIKQNLPTSNWYGVKIKIKIRHT